MTTQEQVEILAVICTRDEDGRHFTERYLAEAIDELEQAGLLTVHKPVHEATGITYSQEHYSVQVTEAGQELLDAHPEYHPKS